MANTLHKLFLILTFAIAIISNTKASDSAQVGSISEYTQIEVSSNER